MRADKSPPVDTPLSGAVATTACAGCGVRLPPHAGPVHAYMTSSPACWHAFGQVLAREYARPGLLETHRLSVDAYAVQHPGDDSRQAIQSVGVHLARLCLFLERGLQAEAANAAMLRVGAIKARMVRLVPPTRLGAVTVADVLAADSDAAHRAAVRCWAEEAWNAWSQHHATVRCWVDAAG